MRSLFGNRRPAAEAPGGAEDAAPSERSTVQVRVLEARGLMPMDTGAFFGVGAADPYLVLQLGDRTHKTKKQKGTLEPVWEEEFSFRGVGEGQQLVVRCFDWDRFTSDDPMGQVVIPTLEMAGMPQWYALQPMAGCEQPRGELRLACHAMFPPDTAAALKVAMHRKKQQAAQALREREEREAAAAAAAAAADDDDDDDDDASVQLTDAQLQAQREEEEARLAEENANLEEEEARLAEEAAARELAEAQAALAEAQVQEEEARLAEEKRLAEEEDLRRAEERLEAAIAGGSAAEIEAARADLAREKAEAEAAADDAAREAREAAQAKAVAAAEMAEAEQASAHAAKERREADAARELAQKERAEANAAAVAAALEQLGVKTTDSSDDGLARATEVGGGYNDNGDRVHRGRKSGGGTRPLSAPHEFKYYCGKAMPGGPLEPTQLAFEKSEAEHKRRYREERDRVLQSDAAKAANGDAELIEPSKEVVIVGSKTVVVDGGVGVDDALAEGLTVEVDEAQGTLTITNADAGEIELEHEVTVLVNPLKQLTARERRRRREAVAQYKKKMEVLRMEAVREWKRQALGAKTIPGLNGLCGPYDGEQCPSCWRYQQALLRDISHTKWRETPAGRATLGEERRVLQHAYSAQRLEPSQTPQHVIRHRRSRFDERAAFALHRRTSPLNDSLVH